MNGKIKRFLVWILEGKNSKNIFGMIFDLKNIFIVFCWHDRNAKQDTKNSFVNFDGCLTDCYILRFWQYRYTGGVLTNVLQANSVRSMTMFVY
jgi:hypothetical protein